MRKLLSVCVVVLLAGCSGITAPGASEKPRLVVLLFVDGLPQRQVVDYRDQLAPDGLRRFLDRGAWFADAHYGYAHTVTAPGHATVLTGAYPHRTGIIGNDWRDPATGEWQSCTGDASARYIGHTTSRYDGTSPKNLRAESLGDVLRRLDAHSKVIGISAKDRGAILPAGKAGTAYIYMAQTGRFTSTTYYMREHPAWVEAFNAKKPADAYFRRQWKPLLDEAAYSRSLPDGQKWYAAGGKLPKTMGEGMDGPGPRFYGQIIGSPFSDELMLAFARAAVAEESLGRDEATDILSVSLSGHDYVNHDYGAESRISHDHVLQLDRLLEKFFRDLDGTVGKDNYLLVLTTDHGFMPVPEHSLALGRDAGRLSGRPVLARLNVELSRQFGEGQWGLGFSAADLVLNHPLIAQRKMDLVAISEAARRQLLAEPGIAVAYTKAELESGSRAGAPFFDAMRKSWHRELSGDVQFALKSYWMMTSGTTGTTHGSPHPYDTHVPILFYGPRWIAPGRMDARVEVADIAPTLSRLLGVPVPSSSEGKPLPLRSP